MPRGRPRSGGATSLETRIQEFASRFAREVIGALRSAPLSDIAALSSSGTLGSAPGPEVAPARPKRKMTNYPKCKWPGCGKNMSPRTRPYCGEHNRRVKAGDGPPASADSAAETARKPGRGKGKKRG